MPTEVKNYRLFITAGISFAFLWGSGSTVTKYGLQFLQPFVFAVCRLFTAAAIMLIIAHVVLGYALPHKNHWKALVIYGLLNLSIFLGMYCYALQFVPGGLGTLVTSTIPIFITIFTGLWLKKKISLIIIFSLILCSAGVTIAGWQIIQLSTASAYGMLILFLGIISNAAGAVYFVGRDWDGLNLITINAWQTLLGGLFLLPICLYNYDSSLNNFIWPAVASVAWLAIGLSTTGILLWLFILRQSAVRASLWLFLCPIIGFAFAAFLLKEPLSWFTAFGVLLVLGGLYLGQKNA